MEPKRYGPRLDTTSQGYWERRAANLLGVSDPRNGASFWDDFIYRLETGWAAGGAGTDARVNGYAGGAWYVSSGTGGATDARYLVLNSATRALTTGTWYVASRCALTYATMAAGVAVGIGIGDSATEHALIGAMGDGSTTKFGVLKEAGGVATGAALAENLTTSVVTLELWKNSAGLYASVNQGAIQSVSTTGLPSATDIQPIIIAQNAGTAEDRRVTADWFHVYLPQRGT